MHSNEYFMKLALQQAQQAHEHDEVPVGAVIVMQNQVIAKGYNQTELLHDVTAHAEIIALTAAFQFLNAKYLPDATLFVTIEPCLMCAGALFWSKIGHIVFGATDPKHGYSSQCKHRPFHPKTTLMSGVLADDSAQLMKHFFKSKRKNTTNL